jgi:alpha-galactosidase
MCAPPARVLLLGDRLDVDWPAMAACTNLVARCRLRDGTVHESVGWTAVGGSAGRFESACGPLDIELTLEATAECLLLQAAATARSEVEVAEVEVAAVAGWPGSDLGWVLANGYQSWDPSGHLRAAGGTRVSWWTIGLADDAGAGIAAAADDARTCCTRFALADGTFTTSWCEAQTLESRPLLFGGPAGAAWRSCTVRLTAAREVRAGLRSLLAPVSPRGATSIGWVSWYHFGPWVDQQDVLAHADLLASDAHRDLGYRLVQVDDGWQEAYGEWRPNTKFPGGLRALSEDLARRGQVAGLWTAPFLVSIAARLASEAPDDWFVADPETGERAIDPQHRLFGPMLVLDASRPAVQAHLRDLFAGFHDAGIRYFKIDFLYAGAYAGLRALRAGMEAIREGAGDAQLVASGVPLLPVAGLVEFCRVGQDTATPLHDFETGLSTPTVFGDEVVSVARNLGARAMLDRWFRLDADVALVGGNLTVEQGRQLVTLAALSGGPFLAGDDLVHLPAERLELLRNPEVLHLVGDAPAPLPDWEPGPGDLPATHWRRGDVLAVFNWARELVEVAVRAPGAAGARDLWARRDLDQFGNGTVLSIPAQGVRLLRLW